MKQYLQVMRIPQRIALALLVAGIALICTSVFTTTALHQNIGLALFGSGFMVYLWSIKLKKGRP